MQINYSESVEKTVTIPNGCYKLENEFIYVTDTTITTVVLGSFYHSIKTDTRLFGKSDFDKIQKFEGCTSEEFMNAFNDADITHINATAELFKCIDPVQLIHGNAAPKGSFELPETGENDLIIPVQ